MTRPTGPVVLLGASGTIGRAVLRALVSRGYSVRCPLRTPIADLSENASLSFEVGDLRQSEFQNHLLDGASAVISCLASRSGVPADAWAVEHSLNSAWLSAAVGAQVQQFILLSALCVQRPELTFQKAKLAFEAELQSAPLSWTIVRPTAFFKSLSGQLDRLRRGKPFLVFGNGRLTACKPISDGDLAGYIVGCLDDPDRANRILPIGGPGPAQTPLEQGAALASAMGVTFAPRHVPVALLSAIIGLLSLAGWFSPRARDKAELARIGRHYATRSMLVWDPHSGTYSDEATPETGSETLQDYYRKLAAGEVTLERGEHAVF
ncbi:MAG: NAD(P)H-binding protein [Pseudomonadota bacterium]